MKQLLILPIAALCAAPLSAQCQNSETVMVETSGNQATPASFTQSMSILETASAAGSFETLKAALGAADLTEALSGDGPFTVFAPTDDAFAALPEGTIASLLKPEAKGMLQNILTYHVVPGRMEAAAVVKMDFLSGLNGQRLGLSLKENGAFLAGAKIVTTDIQCSNGVIHVIDAVMLPNTSDIIDTAVAAGSFETLAAALGTAGLVEALKGDGPFTVFAPTDDAFAKLPEGTVEELLKKENRDKLTSILTYHVVSGRVYGGMAIKAESAATLQGGALNFRFLEDGLRVNGAKVLKSDLDTANGVIHIIDSVLLPE
ncbi:MAG: fasciclin domain-containing protein [Planctomycetota bacterium]|jgi:uncharacterized surface protein with fasciclin (FAS1) repeats